MSPPDSATADDPVIDDDLVQALGFEPATDALLDDDVAPNKLYAEVLDVTGESPVLTTTETETESEDEDYEYYDEYEDQYEDNASDNLIVLDPPPPAPTDAPITPPVLAPAADAAPATGDATIAPRPRRLAPNEADDHEYVVQTSGRGRPKLRARKVRRVVRHIDPWSVLTFSVIFHLFIFGALLLASVVIFNVAEASGTVENIESLIREVADLETFEIDEGAVFRAAVVIAGMLTLAASVMVVLLTVVFNLISDLIGGIRLTVIEEERVRVVRRQQRRANSGGASSSAQPSTRQLTRGDPASNQAKEPRESRGPNKFLAKAKSLTEMVTPEKSPPPPSGPQIQ